MAIVIPDRETLEDHLTVTLVEVMCSGGTHRYLDYGGKTYCFCLLPFEAQIMVLSQRITDSIAQ